MEKLAIHGGKPVRNNPIYYGRQYIDEDDCSAVRNALVGDLITTGPKAFELEQKLCSLTGAKYAVAIANGTAALHAVCFVAGIKNGDEVITTPITFAASANCVLYCGGTPVFADIDPETYNISPACIRDVYMPVIKAVNMEIVKQDMVPFFHCCGNNWDIMDDFVINGYKGYQSIQESAGMDFKKVKDEYGDKLTLWTGVQCETLTSRSIDETEAEVRKNLDILMPGGGFIFGSTNSVQYGAKTDNYLKALEIVRNKGSYK